MKEGAQPVQQQNINKSKSSKIFYIILGFIFVVIIIGLFFIFNSSDNKSNDSIIKSSQNLKAIKDLFVPFKECMNSCEVNTEGIVTDECFLECKDLREDIKQNGFPFVYENLENLEIYTTILSCAYGCRKNSICTDECLNADINIDFDLLRDYHKSTKRVWDLVIDCVDKCPINKIKERQVCSEKCYPSETSDRFDYNDEQYKKIKKSGIYDIIDDYPFYVNSCLYCTDFQGCTKECYQKIPLGSPIKEFVN